MITIDTNLVVRILANDDPIQTEAACRTIEREGGFVQDTVILEAAWVLNKVYNLSPGAVADVMLMLADTETITLEHPARLIAAVEGARAGLDFADAFHLAGCRTAQFATFDKALYRLAPSAFPQVQVIVP